MAPEVARIVLDVPSTHDIDCDNNNVRKATPNDSHSNIDKNSNSTNGVHFTNINDNIKEGILESCKTHDINMNFNPTQGVNTSENYGNSDGNNGSDHNFDTDPRRNDNSDIKQNKREIMVNSTMDCWSLGMCLLQLFHVRFLNFFTDVDALINHNGNNDGNSSHGKIHADKIKSSDATLARLFMPCDELQRHIDTGNRDINVSGSMKDSNSDENHLDEIKQSDVTLARLSIPSDKLQRQIDTYLDHFLSYSDINGNNSSNININDSDSDSNNHKNNINNNTDYNSSNHSYNKNNINITTNNDSNNIQFSTQYIHQRIEIGMKIISIIRTLLRVNPKERISAPDALKLLSSIQVDD